MTNFEKALSTDNSETLAALFREWWNDFVTIERFAEYYEESEANAWLVIERGREAHNAAAI